MVGDGTVREIITKLYILYASIIIHATTQIKYHMYVYTEGQMVAVVPLTMMMGGGAGTGHLHKHDYHTLLDNVSQLVGEWQGGRWGEA